MLLGVLIWGRSFEGISCCCNKILVVNIILFTIVFYFELIGFRVEVVVTRVLEGISR